jgi:GT2 family glycosyltransferase
MTKRLARHPLAVALPSVGFPLTICVLAYGPHVALAERFLGSLYTYTNPSLFHLRAGLNKAGWATQELFRDYAARFKNVTLFIEPRNIFKYPMMRRMFYESPLSSAWTIWCDDDTHFTRPDWLQRLVLKIECLPEVSMWGKPYVLWRRDKLILKWIRAASWYRGLPCVRGKDLKGKDAAKFSFATGGFWAIRTDIVRRLNWPDPRLIHVTGDFLLGEALRQNRLTIGRFDYGVKINDAPRRDPQEGGSHEPRRSTCSPVATPTINPIAS